MDKIRYWTEVCAFLMALSAEAFGTNDFVKADISEVKPRRSGTRRIELDAIDGLAAKRRAKHLTPIT